MAIYRYLAAKYVESFRTGSVRFGALTYYVAHEHPAIGDAEEGSLSYDPRGGLRLNINSSGDGPPVAGTLRSSVLPGIYALCTSLALNPVLAHEFGDTAIEILDVTEFVQRLEAALVARGAATPDNVRHRPIDYHDSKFPTPYIEWALPEKIAFFKRRAKYGHQEEYRFAFGPPGAWDVENVSLDLELRPTLPGGEHRVERYKVAPIATHRPASPSAGVDLHSADSHVQLEIGDIRHICRVHNP